MPSANIFGKIAARLDLGNAVRVAQMGLKQKQLGGVLGAYFSGKLMPRLGSDLMESGMMSPVFSGAMGPRRWRSMAEGLAARPSNFGTAALRATALGMGGVAAYSMLPQNNALAAGAGAGAFAATYAGLGALAPGMAGGMWGRLGRGAAGLAAGSMAWSGLRSPQTNDYMMRG